MFEPSITKLLVLAFVVLVLFGRGKISEFMGEFGKGIKSFKDGVGEDLILPSSPTPMIAPRTALNGPVETFSSQVAVETHGQ